VRGGGAWLCAAEVHGSHALESCGLLSRWLGWRAAVENRNESRNLSGYTSYQ